MGRTGISAALAVLAMLWSAGAAQAAYVEQTPPLDTRWTSQVSRTDPLLEHPRPQLVRDAWMSLNGQWDYGRTPAYGETVLVPFPVTSALSGIQRNDRTMFYRRTFTVPTGWSGRRVLLHFGAVNHLADVAVNGVPVGSHRGSYDAFSFDVTDQLRPGANEVTVRAVDPGNFAPGFNPAVGKQFETNPQAAPSQVLFTPASGIWQTVWLEAVGAAHVTRLDQVPDPDRERLVVTPRVTGGEGTRVVLRARAGDRVVGTASGAPGSEIAVPVPRPRLWSPDDPYLYDLDVEVRRGDVVIDRARSYFGMRTIELRRIGGVMRPVLNGEPVFQMGTLDQGYWPDGLYTAPTDEALRFDIEGHKRLGFNTIRKHVKVEPQRWYHHADRLGVLVWQDMPNMTIYKPVTEDDERQFERELREMIDEHRSSPAIVTWVPFNEGWGEFDVERVTAEVEAYDRTRLVDGHSGAANCCEATEPSSGHFRDTHTYPGPFVAPADEGRATVTGEFGGVALRTSREHEYPEKQTGAPSPITYAPSVAAANGQLRAMYASLRQQVRSPGLSGAFYVEITDVENEYAGILTYDREVHKLDPALLRRLNRELIAEAGRAAGRAPLPAAVPPGAAGAWSFDEGEGTVARDASGRGHDLVLGDGARFEPGRRGGALRLDGGQARTRGPVVDTAGSFTVSAWLEHRDRSQSAAAVIQEGAGEGAGFALGVRTAPQRPDTVPAYAVADRSGLARLPYQRWSFAFPGRAEGCGDPTCFTRADTGYDDGQFGPPVDRWQHVTGVVDRETRSATLSIDGVPVDNRYAEQVWRTLGPLVVGAGQRTEAGPDRFAGSVDDLRVYGRALAPGEVQQLFVAQGGRLIGVAPESGSAASGERPGGGRPAPRLRIAVTPRRDRRGARRFVVRGRLVLPRGVTPAAGCRGRVTVTFKAGRRTISTRRVRLGRTCTVRSRTTFRATRRFGGRRALRVLARFEGTSALRPVRAPARTVRVG